LDDSRKKEAAAVIFPSAPRCGDKHGMPRLTVLMSVLFVICFAAALHAEYRGITQHVQRLALVIGNGAYLKTAPLNNPINDAVDVTSVLTDMGFEVVLRLDADQKTMEDAVRYFGRLLNRGGVGLFYFAGHGVQVEGRNFLLPIDARIESESDVKYEAVDAGLVLGKMEDAENQLNIVILDACRNNPYAKAFRSDQSGLAHGCTQGVDHCLRHCTGRSGGRWPWAKRPFYQVFNSAVLPDRIRKLTLRVVKDYKSAARTENFH